MPDLPDLPDLATPAARETVPPPFEAVVDRARRHRRRTVLTTALATVVVLGAAAAGASVTTGDDRSAPQPVGPTPSATSSPSPTAAPTPAQASEAELKQIIVDGRLVSYAVNAEGSLMTVWQSCKSWDKESSCRTAWQLQGHAGIKRGLVGGHFAAAEAAGDYIAVTSWNRPGVVIDDSGQSRPLQVVDSGTVVAGDALVRLGKSLGVVDPVAAELWPLPVPVGVDGWVEGAITPDGTVWSTSSTPDPIEVRVASHQPRAADWQQHTISTSFEDGPAPGPIAVTGDHVAVLSMHDGVDVATYGRFAVTTDGGATWSDLRPSDLPFDNVDAMAATSGGTLYVASQDGGGHDRLFRSTDGSWTRFSEVRDAPEVYQLVAAGDRVIARGDSAEYAEIYKLDDAGHVTHWASLR